MLKFNFWSKQYCCAALKSPVNVSPKKSELDPCHTSASINSQFCGISSRRSLRIIGGQRAHKGKAVLFTFDNQIKIIN